MIGAGGKEYDGDLSDHALTTEGKYLPLPMQELRQQINLERYRLVGSRRKCFILYITVLCSCFLHNVMGSLYAFQNQFMGEKISVKCCLNTTLPLLGKRVPEQESPGAQSVI